MAIRTLSYLPARAEPSDPCQASESAERRGCGVKATVKGQDVNCQSDPTRLTKQVETNQTGETDRAW